VHCPKWIAEAGVKPILFRYFVSNMTIYRFYSNNHRGIRKLLNVIIGIIGNINIPEESTGMPIKALIFSLFWHIIPILLNIICESRGERVVLIVVQIEFCNHLCYPVEYCGIPNMQVSPLFLGISIALIGGEK
jgi:hypothetical protein